MSIDHTLQERRVNGLDRPDGACADAQQPDAGAVDAGVRAAEEAERGDHAHERPRPGDGTKRVTSI